jgi:uncharacterized protein YjbJ (UPF0337 family)
MSHEEEKGATKQVKGKILEAAEALTDNQKMEAKGKLEKTEGKAKEKISRLKRKMDKATHEDDDPSIHKPKNPFSQQQTILSLKI